MFQACLQLRAENGNEEEPTDRQSDQAFVEARKQHYGNEFAAMQRARELMKNEQEERRAK